LSIGPEQCSQVRSPLASYNVQTHPQRERDGGRMGWGGGREERRGGAAGGERDQDEESGSPRFVGREARWWERDGRLLHVRRAATVGREEGQEAVRDKDARL
jgi:hypothetical protein